MAVVRHQARGRTRSRRAPAPLPDASKPVEYAAFSRYVRRFKTRKFLRLVAKHQTLHWNQDRPLDSLLLKPHAGSLIAFEAMASWGAQGQVSPTLDDLRRLDALVIALDDPILTSPVLGASDDLMVRMSFQQFPYQHPPFNDTARLRPMFEREYPADKFQVVNKTLIDELLGTDVGSSQLTV